MSSSGGGGGGGDGKSQKKRKRNVADLLVECLVHEGLEVCFGLPGEENADFVMALDEHKDDIRFILGRHEQASAFGADVYGRLTGKPAVVFSTLGPGSTNLMTGIADANMDRSPCVVITGQASTTRMHRESHQAIDVRAMLAPVTKWGATITDPSTVAEIVRKAFKVATLEKMGVTHIELPENIAAMEVPDDLGPLPRLDKVRRSVPDDKAIDQVFDLLRAAKRPVILAGNGVLRHGASKQLVEFCEATRVPVVNTFMGKGVVPKSKPYSVFTVGLSTGDHNNDVIEQSDLVLSMGFDIVEYPPKNWNPKGELTIAHLDFVPAEVDAHYRCAAEAVGDLSHSLWMLNERLKREPYRVKDTAYYDKPRQRMLADFEARKDDTGEGPVAPQKVLYDIEAELPDAVLICDVGSNKFWTARHHHSEHPNSIIISNGWCSMGIALPGAIGARLAHPDRDIIALAGDGGFLMNVHEMEVATRENLKLIVIVWVDEAYGLIKFKQELSYDNKSTRLQFTNPDFMKLADAFGWASEKVTSSDQMAPALRRAKASDKSVLLAVDIDYENQNEVLKQLGKCRSQ